MSAIAFEAAPFLASESWIDGEVLLRLPPDVSEQLPSRGMSMVVGVVNGAPLQVAVEPDGEGSHWFRIGPDLLAEAGLTVGEPAKFTLEPTKQWPEPRVPEDLRQVLIEDPKAEAIWNSLTPSARWDWVRWATAARQEETRKRRVDSVPSRLHSGKRRPCCFDRSQCTLTDA